MDIIQKIQTLEKKNSDNKLELAKLSEREKTIIEEIAKVNTSIKELGLTTDALPIKIKEMEEELNKQIKDIEENLNESK